MCIRDRRIPGRHGRRRRLREGVDIRPLQAEGHGIAQILLKDVARLLDVGVLLDVLQIGLEGPPLGRRLRALGRLARHVAGGDEQGDGLSLIHI